ncbi:hypothetical protein TWF481_010789 [Arthrobotrys musiformis]|uniref:Uncharacterized protein n=1 Tax=Arthrobotrys musiformis TaxID=47236 RepID=A0AAV9W2V7_9PEZI
MGARWRRDEVGRMIGVCGDGDLKGMVLRFVPVEVIGKCRDVAHNCFRYALATVASPTLGFGREPICLSEFVLGEDT